MLKKFMLLIRIIILLLMNLLYLIFSESKYIFIRYKHDAFNRRMNMEYWEEASPGIAFIKCGIKKFIFVDVELGSRSRRKLGRKRLDIPKKIFLGMSLIMPGGLFLKFICKFIYNVISLILYVILPRKGSKRFDMFILRKVRIIYWILYRIDGMFNQVLYINFVIIPLFILRIIIEFILLPLELLIYIVRNPIGGIDVLLAYIFYPVRNLYYFFTDNTSIYILKRFLKVEERKLRRDYRRKQRRKKIENIIAKIKRGLIFLFKTVPLGLLRGTKRIIVVTLLYVYKGIKLVLDPIISIAAGILVYKISSIRKIFISLFNGTIVRPVLGIYKMRERFYKLIILLCKLSIILVKPLNRGFINFLIHEKRYEMRLYRNILWQIGKVGDIYFRYTEKLKVESKSDIYFEELVEVRRVSSVRKRYMNNYVSNGEIFKLLFKLKLNTNGLTELFLILNKLDMRGGKGDNYIANLLIYMSRDLNKLETVEKQMGSLDILNVVKKLLEIGRNMREPLSVHYRQPDFQTERKNKLIPNKGSISKIYNRFIESKKSYYLEKHKDVKGINFAKKYLMIGKREAEGGGYGTTEENTEPIQMPDGTYVYESASIETEQQIYSKQMQDKEIKERNEQYWKPYVDSIREGVNTQQQTTEKIIKLFYLNYLESLLKYNISEDSSRGWNISEVEEIDRPWGEGRLIKSPIASFDYKDRPEMRYKDKETFLNFVRYKSKELWIMYNLGSSTRDMRLFGVARKSENEGVRTFIKNKPFVNNILNRIDSYFSQFMRNWELPGTEHLFINEKTDIDLLSKKEKIKVYRLQQDWGKEKDIYDWSNANHIDNEMRQEAKDEQLEKVVITKEWYNLYLYLFIDYITGLYQTTFYDYKIKDFYVAKVTKIKFLLNKYNLIRLGGYPRRRGVIYAKVRVMLKWYISYIYIFHSDRHSYKLYKNTHYLSVDYLHDTLNGIRSYDNSRKERRKLPIVIILGLVNLIEKLVKMMIKLLKKLLGLWLKFVFFLHYYL